MKLSLRKKFVESPGSLGEKARHKRAQRFAATFPRLHEMKVLDLGGTLSFWHRLPVRPLSVVSLNVVASDTSTPEVPWYRNLVGDACDPPSEIAAEQFDLVFSNSTIEHVGDREKRKMFADVVHRSADRHWIQTPNRAFPIEPHVLFPLQQFLPRYGRALVLRYWPFVHTNSTSMRNALIAADTTDLIDRAEFTELFPNSRIENEQWVRFIPAKSLIAIRT